MDRRSFMRRSAAVASAAAIGDGLAFPTTADAETADGARRLPDSIQRLRPLSPPVVPMSDAERLARIEKARRLMADNGIAAIFLEEPATAKSLRIRKGRQMITDGPFSESKEVLGGFNLIEAENMEEALKIAAEFPWAETGCVEVRPVRDLEIVRQRVSGAKATATR